MKPKTPAITRSQPLRPKEATGSLYKLLLAALLAACLSWSASAQVAITNYFTDGLGTDPTPLDQYASAPGNGWLGGWVFQAGLTNGLTASVISSVPLAGGGNYLNWSIGGANSASTLRRGFSNVDIDITQPYVVEFDYRVDVWISGASANFANFSSSSDYISFQQNSTADLGNDVRGKGSFWIRAQGAANTSQPGLAPKFWSFYDGNPATTTESLGLYVNSTNVPLATNVVYHFKLQMDPLARLYEGTVSDGVNTFNTTTATGRKLRWRQFGPSLPFTSDFNNSTMLAFISRGSTVTETNLQSLDNLTVYQVPTNLWPPRVTQIIPVRAQTFYPASSNLVLNLVTYGTNYLPSSNVVLNLNGVLLANTNGLTFDGDDGTNNRTITYSGLQDNKVYEATLSAADQAGRSTAWSFFFDTFVTNYVSVIEIENFNFDPAATPCSPTQTDTSRTDRYIQNWLYSGLAIDGSTLVNVADGYFMRAGVAEIDFHVASTANTGSNFRNCPPGINIRNEASDDYNRGPLLWNDGVTALRENPMERVSTNMWFNYTHEWPNTNYLVYLRGGSVLTNYTFQLDEVTSGYDTTTQTPSQRGLFQMPTNIKKEILKNYPLTDDSGYTRVLPLNGKQTLRLTGLAGAAPGDNRCMLNYMVFVPVPSVTGPILIENTKVNGSDLSFDFNTVKDAPYSVQYTTDLTSGTWILLKNLIGTGNPVVVRDTAVGGMRYYRVLSPTP